MSLAVRIIPCLDVDAGRVVKGTKFLNLRDAGNPVEVAKRYNKEGADELVFLDITASSEKRDILLDVVKKTAQQVFIPLTVGGGVRSIEDIRTLLRAGADKVSINTSAVQNPSLVRAGAKQFGSQCIVVAIDAKKVESSELRIERLKSKVQSPKSLVSKLSSLNSKLKWEVYIHGGRTPTGLDAVAWAKRAEQLGAGEILLTSMDMDGTQNGYDLELLLAITKNLSIPVIASGGAGKKEHFYQAWKIGGASACLAASLFHYKQLSIGKLKHYLKSKKVPVRI